ncbi:MAG: DUF2057 family protein [Thiohalophilus sp.]|jgi:predicted small lipoprotein YifL
MKSILSWQLLLLILSTLLAGCTPIGPVKFYDGPDRAENEIARVKVPGPITMKSIDGRKIDAPSIEDGFYELHLLPGQHTLNFEYALVWGSAVSSIMIKSDERRITSDFAAGQVYELTYDEPKSENEAFDLASDFKATLVAVDGSTQVASQGVATNHSSGILPFAASETPVVDTTAATPAPMPNAEQASREDAVKRLKFWWLMASEKEREEFRQWMQTDMPNFNQQ